MKRASRQAGTSLVEVLVTIVITAIGLLGLAGMQSRLQTSEMESYQRAQALLLLEDMASYSTGDALAVAFGDMRETYTIVDRIGIRTLRDPYSSKPYVEFYTTARVGGDALNFDAMKFLKFGTS